MSNITYHENNVSREMRQKLMSQRGCVVWLTGLSGSGKSTLAVNAERKLYEKGIKTYILDGDNIRFGLNSNLGFSTEDRDENVRRLGEVARLMADSGLVVFVPAVSPTENGRENARKIAEKADIPFFECYVDADVSVCASRDPKGLYKKAMAGEIANFTGVSAPYDIPENPDIIIKSGSWDADTCAEKLVKFIMLFENADSIMKNVTDIAVEAGRRILTIYNKGFNVEYKADSSPLTDADKAADGYINERLSSLYPDFARLSEETADDGKRRENDICFIIDPLDGTKEFVKRNGEFTVNIGLAFGGKSIAGAVYVPVSGDLYYAFVGIGSYKTNGRPHEIFDKNDRIHVTDKTEDLIFMNSRSHSDEKTDKLLEMYKDKISSMKVSGSSIKGCMIASGDADIYYRFGLTCEWDTCAMQAVVENAGGILIQGDGTKMTYNREKTLNEKGFIIVNRKENIWII